MTKGICIRILTLIIILTILGCGEKSQPTTPDPPAPPTIPDCERYSTAAVVFQNRSNTGLTYDVVVDGTKLLTLAPNTSSNIVTLASGQHTILFKVTNTNLIACQGFTVNLAMCSEWTYWCDT